MGTQRDAGALVEQVDPVEAVAAAGAGVAAEEVKHGRDVRLQDAEALGEENEQRDRQDVEDRRRMRKRQGDAEVPRKEPDEGPGRPEQQDEPEGRASQPERLTA